MTKGLGTFLKLDSDFVKREIQAFVNNNNINISSVGSVDYVVSVGTKIINLGLKNSNGPIIPKDGFLIEVFESGSNGTLTRLYKESVEDPADDSKTLFDGFSNYFRLDIDV